MGVTWNYFCCGWNLNVMTAHQLFECFTSTVIEDTPQAEDSIMEHDNGNVTLMKTVTEDMTYTVSRRINGGGRLHVLILTPQFEPGPSQS